VFVVAVAAWGEIEVRFENGQDELVTGRQIQQPTSSS
jgi:hypothetical protein